MIRKLRHSIRGKLIVLLTLVAAVSVLTVSCSLLAYQFHHHRTTLRDQSETQARLVANQVAAALVFDDSKTVNETLFALRGDERVQSACLFDRKGRLAGFYVAVDRGAGPCPDFRHATEMYTLRVLHLSRPVVVQGDTLGTLYLDISLEETYRMLLRIAEVSAVMSCCAIFFAFLLSSVTERLISRPLLLLTAVASRVSRQNDYSIRAHRKSHDEVGLLIDQFNAMLGQIEQRDNELRAHREHLEDMVRERTDDLQAEIAERKLIEQDLNHAKVAAEESNRAKSSFLANMSHELRTPLNAIIGYSEILHEDARAMKQKEMVEDLNKVLLSAHHLLRLISDVLDLSKIEAGQMTVNIESVLIPELLREVLPTAEMLGQKNGNRIESTVQTSATEFHTDSLRFRQSLLNLVSNACKFTENGTVSILVKDVHRGGKDCLVWAVRDTGIGIAPEHREKLFKHFSQIDDANTRTHSGTGLGLSISLELCRAMGGWIEVDSEVGVGSTFSIFLPAGSAVLAKEVTCGNAGRHLLETSLA